MTQDKSGSAHSLSTSQSPLSQDSLHPSDEELLRWMLECPHGLKGVAKTSHEEAHLRELLLQWLER